MKIAITIIACLALLLLSEPHVTAQEKPEAHILIKNVKVFDGVNDRLTLADVLIKNNLIKSVGAGLKIPKGTTIIDGGGRTLMPGLIDSHVHFNVVIEGGLDKIEASRWDRIAAVAAHSAQEWLMDGFTTVRGMGGMGNGLKMTIDEGLLAGPRIYPSGSYISQTAGHGDILLGSQDPKNSNLVRLGISQLADGPDRVRAAVRKNFVTALRRSKSWWAVACRRQRDHCLLRSTRMPKYEPPSRKLRPETLTSPSTCITTPISEGLWNRE